jgi:hypothetical protein
MQGNGLPAFLAALAGVALGIGIGRPSATARYSAAEHQVTVRGDIETTLAQEP